MIAAKIILFLVYWHTEIYYYFMKIIEDIPNNKCVLVLFSSQLCRNISIAASMYVATFTKAHNAFT